MEQKQLGLYTLLEKIGKGGQATVWKARDQNNNLVAIKKMSAERNEDTTRSYEREVAIMKLVRHEYLIRSIDSFQVGDNYYLVYEFCPLDMLTFLQKQNEKKFPERVIKKWIWQIIQVMSYLNKHRIIHRDLKPENILLTDQSFEADIRLTDFGMAKQGLSTLSFVGTLEYASPEIKNCQEYSYNTDVWSLGVIFFAGVFGKLPVLQGQKLAFPRDSLALSEEGKSFIERCLTFNNMLRPTFDVLDNDPYFLEIKIERMGVNESSIKRNNEVSIKRNNEVLEQNDLINNQDIPAVRNPANNEAVIIINDEIPDEVFPQNKLPNTRPEIEDYILKVFFMSSDVLDFVERSGQDMQFLKYFVAKHFTDKFRYILDNLMNLPAIQEFSLEFFDMFFGKSERICNIDSTLEKDFKNLNKDDYFAFSWQIEELIASSRNNVHSSILEVLQEISHNLKKDSNN